MNSSDNLPQFVISPEQKRVYLGRREVDAQDLRASLNGRDYRRIREIGHRIKGSARLFGFLGLEVLAKKLEEAGDANDPEKLAPLVSEFETTVLAFIKDSSK